MLILQECNTQLANLYKDAGSWCDSLNNPFASYNIAYFNELPLHGKSTIR